ncbi:unnamed protein product [Mytilus coruscus]|uniref:Uncharacterized protein n=1 Tax=Mytilus coruscus TaxID=42192 RepID=A0A6J8CGN8_MYTCO|nr:unnamed protein product [Mytilus coruscus]
MSGSLKSTRFPDTSEQQASYSPRRKYTCSRVAVMEYNFMPQWRPWFFQMRQIPACARCGNQHRYTFCFAESKKCFKCHYARMCVSRPHQEIQKCKDVPQIKTKSKSQKDRDSRRIKEYFDSKSYTRSLPFANLRDSAFKSCLDSTSTSILKCELTCVKKKLSTEQKKGASQAAESLNLREQLRHLQSVSVENEVTCRCSKLTRQP